MYQTGPPHATLAPVGTSERWGMGLMGREHFAGALYHPIPPHRRFDGIGGRRKKSVLRSNESVNRGSGELGDRWGGGRVGRKRGGACAWGGVSTVRKAKREVPASIWPTSWSQCFSQERFTILATYGCEEPRASPCSLHRSNYDL